MNGAGDKWWLAAGAAFTALGLSWVMVVGALAGAVATMVLTSGEAMRVRAANAVVGIMISLVATPAVGAYIDVKPLVNGVLAMVIALWGMAVLREINEWVRAGGLKGIIAGLASRLPRGGA
jgi:hypothetical protein